MQRLPSPFPSLCAAFWTGAAFGLLLVVVAVLITAARRAAGRRAERRLARAQLPTPTPAVRIERPLSAQQQSWLSRSSDAAARRGGPDGR